MPSNAKLLPFRSNIPELSKHCFSTIVDDFNIRAKENNGGFIIAGENYGQGSSREHAALVPLIFKNKTDYDKFIEFDELEIKDAISSFDNNCEFILINKTRNISAQVLFEGSQREIQILKYGGYLNFAKKSHL